MYLHMKMDRNRMRVKKGQLRPSPNEEAQLIKEETEKRRKLRLKQVREQSKENAAKIRQSVKHEKHKQLMKLATEIKTQLEEEKAERVRHLEQQYDNSLRNIGLGHRDASLQPDWSEEREMVMKAENLRAEARGIEAMERLREETARKMMEAQRITMARKQALEVERSRAADIAAMPPPPPDPVNNIDLNRKPVKVTDMNTYSTSHYHLMNEHVVDKADTAEQRNAREAAELEEERIKERSLELKRLRQDQLERARLRHNVALEKELLKYDYNNILHDLSDLQRADRERRLRIVHNIPKQVFEPPNVRMEDREDRQKQMEQEFEDMYMAGTDYMGNVSMALDPHPQPETPSGTASLDITTTSVGTPLQEPTLPSVPPVLRDMTNMPKPKSPGKKPEKVLRNLMDRIKSQREEWMMTQSMVEVGEGEPQTLPHPQQTETDRGLFQMLIPDDSSPISTTKGLSPPEKLARVMSPEEALAVQHEMRPVPQPRQSIQVTSAPPAHVVPVPPVHSVPAPVQHITPAQKAGAPVGHGPTTVGPGPDSRSQDIQQIELAEILKQQELILDQKRQLELKLQQLNHQHQTLQVANKLNEQQQQIQQQQQQQPTVSHAPPSQPIPVQQFTNSLSSSTTSNQPMNSIPPTHTTNSVPMTTAYQGQGQGHMSSAYQPVSAALTAAQLLPPVGSSLSNGFGEDVVRSFPSATLPQGQGQGQMMVGMPTVVAPVSTPSFVGAVSADAHNEQMKRVREYQQYLLARHEQSKRVLAETKAEIKRRRDNLMERYPKLDLTRLEDLGAKYLDTQTSQELPESVPLIAPLADQGHIPFTSAEVQGQMPSVPVTSLLASLASHPYYAQTLTKSLTADMNQLPSQLPNGMPTSVVAGHVQVPVTQPDINFDTNLRKNKYDTIRKSLPFDTDDSFQSPSVRVYEAYTSKPLDTTTGTEATDADTSTSTERGSPNLKPPTKFQPLKEEESEGDSSTSGSLVSENDTSDALASRQEELLHQLADIQRQKEEIMQRHATGQERVQLKQDQLKAKLATVSKDDPQAQLRDTFRRVVEAKQNDIPQPSTSETSVYPTSEEAEDSQMIIRRQNLSTILEVETPASTRPSDGTQDRLSLGSSGSGTSFLSRKSLEGYSKTERIPEEPRLENIETQMQKQKEEKANAVIPTEPVASYSGMNIENILERAKRFETEVLEKLRKQTSAVLFDKEFDDSLEFDVSDRQKGHSALTSDSSPDVDVARRQAVAALLSSGSLTPDSLSTGPLDDSDIARSRDLQSANGSFQVSKSRDSHTANGSFQSSRSWADELSSYKMPPSDQAELAFKVMKSDLAPDSQEKPPKDGSIFTSDVNRFKVYSMINKSDSSSEESSDSITGAVERRTVDAGDMLKHLRNLQEELWSGEQTRKILEQNLADRQTKPREDAQELSQYSMKLDDKSKDMSVSCPDQELSQYSFSSDKSGDKSLPPSKERQPSPVQGIPVLSGTSSVQREMPVRKSPIGDFVRPRSPMAAVRSRSPEAADTRQEVTATEYSFTMTDGKQRSTSTPGDDRSKTVVEKSRTSELPSEITLADVLGNERSIPGSSVSKSQYLTPTIHVTEPQPPREQDRGMGPRIHATLAGSEFSTYSAESERESGVDHSSSGGQFQTMLPDSQQQLDTFSSELKSFLADETPQGTDEGFKKLVSEKPKSSVKTYAVTIDGDLVSEHSDSDKSLVAGRHRVAEDLTTYSLSSVDESIQGFGVTKDSQGLGTSELSSITKDSTRSQQMSDYTYKSSSATNISDSSEDSHPKSSSLTNVTSDTSLSINGASNLSQFTVKTEDMTSAPNLTQYTMKSDDITNGQDLSQYSLKSADVSRKDENKSANATEDGSNYLQEKFASLDNLISESKTLIAKHKVLVDKNKQMEEPNTPSEEESVKKPERGTTPGVQTLTTQESNVKKFKEWYMSTPGIQSGTESETSKLSSFNASSADRDTSTATDVESLEYLVEHSSGITEEPLPDLTTMTLGSELSMTEAFNKTDLSDSDSLKSFEKHEMSTGDSESLSNSRTDDSWAQDIVESRRQNFIAQSERRAAAAKEKALSACQKKDNDDVVFRAVPVSVVAEPTLSMSAKASGVDRGKPVKTVDVKGAQHVKDVKKSIEAKESELIASKSALNRALQPRGGASARQADAGTKPRESGARPKDMGDKPTGVDKKKMGALTGEIKSFGGSAGLASKQPPAKKIPPQVKPKPVRSKSTGAAPPPIHPKPSAAASAPPPVPQATSSLSKTLSSWKKSRSLSMPATTITETESVPPSNSIKVLPSEAPEPLTEEERQQRVIADNIIYQRNMRAYNPRLFRLERQLDTDEPVPPKKTSPEVPRSSSLDRKDSRKKAKVLVKKKTRRR